MLHKLRQTDFVHNRSLVFLKKINRKADRNPVHGFLSLEHVTYLHNKFAP